jgi:hypothetical protein
MKTNAVRYSAYFLIRLSAGIGFRNSKRIPQEGRLRIGKESVLHYLKLLWRPVDRQIEENLEGRVSACLAHKIIAIELMSTPCQQIVERDETSLTFLRGHS